MFFFTVKHRYSRKHITPIGEASHTVTALSDAPIRKVVFSKDRTEEAVGSLRGGKDRDSTQVLGLM